MPDLPLGENQIAQANAMHELADVKGHFVYEMLERKIGRDKFIKGLREAIRIYSDKKMTLDDLIGIFQKESGQDLHTFANQWFRRTGAPEFDLSYHLESEGAKTRVIGQVDQAGNPYEVQAEIGLYSNDTCLLDSLDISGQSTPFSFESNGPIDSVVFDPYYKIFRYTPEFKNLPLLEDGTMLRVNGKFDDAVALLERYLEFDSTSLEGHYQLARAYQGASIDSLAMFQFQRVVDLYANGQPYDWPVPYAHLNLSKLYLARHDTTAARNELIETEKFPQEPSAYQSAAAMLDSLGK